MQSHNPIMSRRECAGDNARNALCSRFGGHSFPRCESDTGKVHGPSAAEHRASEVADMPNLTIRTNNVPRDVIDAQELSADERAQFDYIDWPAIDRGQDSASFFRYRGDLYDLSEFEVWDNPASPTRGEWDGFRSDSYFSGLAVRYVDDRCERIIVALVMS